jgi:hypothetical protein
MQEEQVLLSILQVKYAAEQLSFYVFVLACLIQQALDKITNTKETQKCAGLEYRLSHREAGGTFLTVLDEIPTTFT